MTHALRRRRTWPLAQTASLGWPMPAIRGDGRRARAQPEIRSRVTALWIAGSSRIKSGNDEEKKERTKEREGSGTPTDAGENCPHQRVRGAPRRGRLAPTLRCGRARLSAFHHGSCQGEISSPRRCSRPCFPGRGLAPLCHIPIPGAETDAVFAGVTRLHPSQFKRAPRTPVVSAGRLMPEAARERGVTPPAGTVLAPPSGLPPEGVLHERVIRSCNANSDKCQ